MRLPDNILCPVPSASNVERVQHPEIEPLKISDLRINGGFTF